MESGETCAWRVNWRLRSGLRVVVLVRRRIPLELRARVSCVESHAHANAVNVHSTVHAKTGSTGMRCMHAFMGTPHTTHTAHTRKDQSHTNSRWFAMVTRARETRGSNSFFARASCEQKNNAQSEVESYVVVCVRFKV